MTSKQNLTIQLDPATIRKAKWLAAFRGVSIGKLVAETLEQILSEDAAYQRAERRALKLLKTGLHLGGGPKASKDELHGR